MNIEEFIELVEDFFDCNLPKMVFDPNTSVMFDSDNDSYPICIEFNPRKNKVSLIPREEVVWESLLCDINLEHFERLMKEWKMIIALEK